MADSTENIAHLELNLVEIQRRTNLRKLRKYKKFEHTNRLHDLDKEIKARIEKKPKSQIEEDPAKFSYKPKIDETSNLIMQTVGKDVLSRTYDWMNKKLKHREQLTKDQIYKQDEDYKYSTTKHVPIGKSKKATSKVKEFIKTNFGVKKEKLVEEEPKE